MSAAAPAAPAVSFDPRALQSAVTTAVQQAVTAQLQPLREELADLKRLSATAAALASVYQSFRLAFFRGRKEPLSIPNIDYLLCSLVQSGIRFDRYDAATRRIVLEKDGVRFATDAYFYILLEMFAQEEYRVFRSLADRPFVLYDLGMNRGYGALWFANHPLCRAVHGFELCEEPYRFALDNFALNPLLAAKIHPQHLGLGGENKTVDVVYEEATDGVSTVMPEFFASFWSAQRKAQARKRPARLRRASEALAELPSAEPGDLRVLKIDVEGAEYDILADLAAAGQLDFDVILAEAHLGVERFLALTPGYRVLEIVRHSDQMANLALVRG